MNKEEVRRTLERIEQALREAEKALEKYIPGNVAYEYKTGTDPVTEADCAVDTLLKELLPREGEGWLSEETADDPGRLERERVWIVDPLDGTREFVAGIPQWCVSIALVEAGAAVAGGVLNPASGECVLGGAGVGVTVNGIDAGVRELSSAEGIEVLASNSEIKRCEWERFEGDAFSIKSVGSVAYKLALVGCGRADCMWTPQPKSEWDIAAGVAIVEAGGGVVMMQDGEKPVFNREKPKVPNLLGCPKSIAEEVFKRWFKDHKVVDCRSKEGSA